MENKLTAVERIEYELSKLNSAVITAEITQEEYHKQRVRLWEQAKQMEKEQIIDAFVKCWVSNVTYGTECKKSAKEYYNETYGR